MSEQTNAVLAQMLADYQQGKEFVLEQAPEVLRQILAVDLIMAWIGFVVGVIASVSFLYFFWATRKNWDYDAPDWMPPAACVMFLVGLLGVVVVPLNLSTIIKIEVAPKVYLIEYAARLAK